VLVEPRDELMLITSGGVLVRTRVAEIREMGRATQGVTLIAIDEGTRLSGVQRVVEGDGDEDPADTVETPPSEGGAAPGADSSAD
jgi:DNA gyrase subunit A